MFRSIVLLVGGLASLTTGIVFAQNAALGQKYGQGVHAFFSGDFVGTYEQMTAAVDAGSKDPRVFYFRGLAFLQLGREQEAAKDFQKGAGLEATDTNKFYDVSKALERVQGPGRAALESYRVNARMAVMERAERLRKARYEAIQREESRVLRAKPLTSDESNEKPKAEVHATAEATTEAAAQPAVNAEPAAAAAPKDPEKPAAKKSHNLLGAIGKAMGKAAAGTTDQPAVEKKSAEADSSFGAAPAAKEKPAEEARPVTKEKEASADDPFAQ
jgi:hypothetical protein